MTYLELYQRFLREAGYTGELPLTTDDQTGDRLQALDWLNDAYIDIQNHQTNWLFMKSDFSFDTTSGTRSYDVTTIGLTDHERWKLQEPGDLRVYLSAIGTSGEQYLDYVDWELYRQNYLFGATRDQAGFPRIVSIEPDQSLNFYPTPDDTYTIVGEYYRSPVEMADDTDTPVFPSQFHRAVVWRALMYYGAFYAADEKYTHGQNEWRKILRRMQFDQLPRLRFGGPLV